MIDDISIISGELKTVSVKVCRNTICVRQIYGCQILFIFILIDPFQTGNTMAILCRSLNTSTQIDPNLMN